MLIVLPTTNKMTHLRCKLIHWRIVVVIAVAIVVLSQFLVLMGLGGSGTALCICAVEGCYTV